MVNHIKDGTTNSPFISLTRSYSIAWNYAVYSGHVAPSAASPAYVYEIEFSAPLPRGIELLDPLVEILKQYPSPLTSSYHHDGTPDFLLGVVDPVRQAAKLTELIRIPPPGGATARAASLCPELEAMVRVLRDSELLATAAIPVSCIINRYEIF